MPNSSETLQNTVRARALACVFRALASQKYKHEWDANMVAHSLSGCGYKSERWNAKIKEIETLRYKALVLMDQIIHIENIIAFCDQHGMYRLSK